MRTISHNGDKPVSKEHLMKMLSTAVDSHTAMKSHINYCMGIKNIRDLLDVSFPEKVVPPELKEFIVGIISSIQPSDSKMNKHLDENERGKLAAAYLLWTAVHPRRIAIPK